MKALYSDAGKQKLDQLIRPGALCVFDFDGTLSPIVSNYDDAILPHEIRDRLLHLSSLTQVAILTGRGLADIRTRLGFQPHWLVGNHGLEGIPGWEEKSARYREQNRLWYEQLALELSIPFFKSQWVRLEDKAYSLAVHYRAARDHRQMEQALLALFSKLDPIPRVIPGKSVFSLVPADAPHKGCALEMLVQLSQAVSVLYVGDDVTDEDVFHLRRPDLLTIRIGRDVHSEADFYLEQCDDMKKLLDDLINRLSLPESIS